jgi:hypothetical protein
MLETVVVAWIPNISYTLRMSRYLDTEQCWRFEYRSRSHITTDGQSASSSWCLAPLGAGDNYFLYFSCRAPSLVRGRVCILQCNDASSISNYIATDGLLASSSWCHQIVISLFNSLSSRCRAPSSISPWTGWSSPKSKVNVISQSHAP